MIHRFNDALLRLIEGLSDPARRRRTALVFVLGYAAVWTLYGIVAKSSQDMNADMAEMVVWANEQYMAIATETGADMIFLLESFCGHGFNADDPTAPCYRGPGAETWFDLTCIHPNPTGHQQITDMFMAVVNE